MYEEDFKQSVWQSKEENSQRAHKDSINYRKLDEQIFDNEPSFQTQSPLYEISSNSDLKFGEELELETQKDTDFVKEYPRDFALRNQDMIKQSKIQHIEQLNQQSQNSQIMIQDQSQPNYDLTSNYVNDTKEKDNDDEYTDYDVFEDQDVQREVKKQQQLEKIGEQPPSSLKEKMKMIQMIRREQLEGQLKQLQEIQGLIQDGKKMVNFGINEIQVNKNKLMKQYETLEAFYREMFNSFATLFSGGNEVKLRM